MITYKRNTKLLQCISVILTVLLLCMTAASFTGCSTDSQGSDASDGFRIEEDGFLTVDYRDPSFSLDSIPDPVLKSSGKTLTIRDCLGKETEVPADPARIAVLDSFAGEAMIMIGAGDKMVTCPNGVKSDSLLREICPELADLPVIMSGGSFNAEALLTLSPDVIIIKEAIFSSDEERLKLEKLGIPYIVTSYSNMAEQMYALSMIGAAAGGKYNENARKINAYYCDVISRVCSDAAKIPEEQRKSVYHSINEAVRTDGRRSLGNDWITCTGSIDVSAEHSESMQMENDDYYAGLEQIFAWSPDVIICNEATTKDYLLTDEKWTGLMAVRQKQVYNIPVGATRWGQRGSLETFFAMIWLGVTIYPEYYTDFDLRGEVTGFYRDILGLNVDDEIYGLMLSGTGIRNASSVSGT